MVIVAGLDSFGFADDGEAVDIAGTRV